MSSGVVWLGPCWAVAQESRGFSELLWGGLSPFSAVLPLCSLLCPTRSLSPPGCAKGLCWVSTGAWEVGWAGLDTFTSLLGRGRGLEVVLPAEPGLGLISLEGFFSGLLAKLDSF